jgi:hypothetical protein
MASKQTSKSKTTCRETNLFPPYREELIHPSLPPAHNEDAAPADYPGPVCWGCGVKGPGPHPNNCPNIYWSGKWTPEHGRRFGIAGWMMPGPDRNDEEQADALQYFDEQDARTIAPTIGRTKDGLHFLCLNCSDPSDYPIHGDSDPECPPPACHRCKKPLAAK